ncbi:MAG: hypothetical protein R3E50_07565 [Halioglobus sp.]
MHLQIKAALNGAEAGMVDNKILAELKHHLALSRTATLEAERLASNYLTRLASENAVVFSASITHISSSGFTVRLDDNGLTGLSTCAGMRRSSVTTNGRPVLPALPADSS